MSNKEESKPKRRATKKRPARKKPAAEDVKPWDVPSPEPIDEKLLARERAMLAHVNWWTKYIQTAALVLVITIFFAGVWTMVEWAIAGVKLLTK